MRFVRIFISFLLGIKRNEMADVLMCVCVSDPYTYIFNNNHVFCTSKVYQHSAVVIGTRRPPLVKNEFISGSSVLNHRFPAGWLEGRRAGGPKAIYHRRGRLAAVNGQEAFGRRAVKKKEKKPVLRCLTNWLKATQTDAPKTWHTRLAYGEKFFDETVAAGGVVKKIGNDRGRGGFDVGKTENGGLGHNKRQ